MEQVLGRLDSIQNYIDSAQTYPVHPPGTQGYTCQWPQYGYAIYPQGEVPMYQQWDPHYQQGYSQGVTKYVHNPHPINATHSNNKVAQLNIRKWDHPMS
jgi:hypothetical protein